ncbi:MAG: hypothetical protein LC634_01455 [Sphingomonadales bacterium]|nr:hypothetical protein [Sphingomonadales bacterium]
MTELTNLEKSAISAILKENPKFATTVERQLGYVRVTKGIGLLLFRKDGRISLLEGYAVAGESTEDIDFETVSFKITDRPGPYS